MRWISWVFVLILASPVSGQTQQISYDVRVSGLRVASVIVAINDDGSTYALASRTESIGLASLFRDLRFDMAATGTIRDGRLMPLSYREDVDTGRRASLVAMRWQGGIPVIDARQPAGQLGSWDIDPADQSGTLDPLSAMYSIARPRPADALCDFGQEVFDGRRRSGLALAPAAWDGDARSCTGRYTRIAGFTPEEIAERTEFSFDVRFERRGDGLWVLTSVDLQSLYGPVRIVRAED